MGRAKRLRKQRALRKRDRLYWKCRYRAEARYRLRLKAEIEFRNRMTTLLFKKWLEQPEVKAEFKTAGINTEGVFRLVKNKPINFSIIDDVRAD